MIPRHLQLVCWLALPVTGAGAAVAPVEAARSATPREAREAVPPTPPVTTVAGVFARWPALTSDDEPVQLEGVVTATMPSGAFRLHDGELGIYATKSPGVPLLQAGERVRVRGVMRQGGFSPWMTPHQVERLGRGAFPAASPATYAVLASGAADNQWVEIEGVVRSVETPAPRDFVVLDLGMAGGTVSVLVNPEPGYEWTALVDSVVRLRGVAAVNVNRHKQVVEPSFRVPSPEQITVIDAADPRPFEKPLIRTRQLLRYSVGAAGGHRIRTRGVVTRQLSDTMLFVCDDGAGLKVDLVAPVKFRPGDVIEAVGFPVMAEGMAVLQKAVCRRVGAESAPVPLRPALAALRDGSANSELVRITARLVDWVSTGRNITLVLQTGDQLFKGLLSLPEGAALRLPEKNSLVNVTGICVISELEDVWFYQPRAFLVLVAELADLELVQAPPWWTPERLRLALELAAVVLLTAAGWVWLLRRQIGRKRAVIEQQARHAAALEERSRIARELHDTLEQGLTGLSLQMKAMETDLGDTAHPARARLQSARQMLRQSRALARNAIRELRAEAVPARLEGLLDGLKRMADSWNQSGALRIALHVQGEPRALPASVGHHLLGIGTEAITNAVKHGRAESIRIEVDLRATAEVVLRIRDDGAGFDPAQQLERTSGCFGLLGMRERAREVRGDLRIMSSPGQGTEVVVCAPLGGPAPVAGSRNPFTSGALPTAPAVRTG